jgi:hypothetical protein
MADITRFPMNDGEGALRAVRVDDLVEQVARLVGEGSLAAVYRDRVLSQRTRRFELGSGAGERSVEVLHTLLGVELKVGRRRLLCPDLATARYLAVFARLAVTIVAVPYDITQVSRTADELESAWHRTMLLADHVTADRSDRMRSLVHSRLLKRSRAEIDALGPGAERPTFIQNTRQRR